MAAVTMHHFSGLAAPFVRSKGTVSGGVFSTNQHQGGIAVRETAYHASAAADLPIQPFNDVMMDI